MSITAGVRLFGSVLAISQVVPAYPAVAEAPPVINLTPEKLAYVIDPLMQAWIEQHSGAGAVVAVATRDATIFAKGYGQADIEAKQPFTADATLVRPGSISKLFTGIAVMQLVDAGKLDLDRDVNDYIDFTIPTPQGGVPVTLRRLLTHRAGFEEHVKGLFSREVEPTPLGKWVAEGLPRRLFPKGDVEAYSNYGLALAGYLVERTSGEAFAAYIERHIIEPLGMKHSTFQQPLPSTLASMAARPYRSSDQPPIVPFETIVAPAGGLSATAMDMSRFLRMLMNGGELDGIRVISRMRLDEMMTPQSSSPAGYLGLVFFGKKIAGLDAIGHEGETMAFFSDLEIFRAAGVGIFISRDGIGKIKSRREIPNIALAVARRFLGGDPPNSRTAALADEAPIAGIYHSSRRAESTVVRLRDLTSESLITIDGDGNARFGSGILLRHVGRNLYEGPGQVRYALVEGESRPYIATPALQLQHLPGYLDVRWIMPAMQASIAAAAATLAGWPFAALWRRRRKQRFSEGLAERRLYRAVRFVLLVDLTAIVATAVLFTSATADPTMLGGKLDPVILALYMAAWIGVAGALAAVWASMRFWRNGVGSPWARIHHTLLAAGCVMIAWFFVVFRIAGTSLNY